MKWAVISALFLALAGTSAQASVITNGNFEDNVISNNSWRWFGADQVNGWDGSNLEIWRGYAGVQAYSGQQFIELNAHGANKGAWSVFQTFNTVSGARYQLSFAYRARANSNETFSVTVADLNQTLTDHVTGEWRLFTGYFTAGNTSSLLRFTSGNSGTIGNFIDDVQITELPVQINSNPVPTGPTGALLAIAAAALFWRRSQA
jgi:hypothetical protein